MAKKTATKEKKPTPKAITKYEPVLAMNVRIGDKILVDEDNRLALITRFAPDPIPEKDGVVAVKNTMRLEVEYIDGKDRQGTGKLTVSVLKDSMLKRVIR